MDLRAQRAGAASVLGSKGFPSPASFLRSPSRLSSPAPRIDMHENTKLNMFIVIPLGDDPQDGTELVHLTDDLDCGLLRCVSCSLTPICHNFHVFLILIPVIVTC